ncbi:MAG TPA: hypothetical protein VGW36_01085 [Pyrinomonadaceae bacterium]|nr:hypothetical protein [Pyrinomonadaceae bacterium]
MDVATSYALNPPQVALLITEQLLDYSKSSTTAILEGNESRTKKLIGRFSKNAERDRQRLKLQFHLFIPYLAVAVVALRDSTNFCPHAKQIVDEIVSLFYEAFNESSKPIDGGLVIGDEFIKDQTERDIILAELKLVNPAFANLTGLPRMGLTATADMLLERRLNEYRVMWIDDIVRMDQDCFIAPMPTRVYQHWSGGNPRSFESLSFSVLLFGGLIALSTTLAKVFNLMDLKMTDET